MYSYFNTENVSLFHLSGFPKSRNKVQITTELNIITIILFVLPQCLKKRQVRENGEVC
jgi:hypothetical protein